MSEENVELWRASIEDFLATERESDWEGWITRATALWDPEIEWDASELGVPGLTGIHRGKEAVNRFWRDWLGAWETSKFDYELLDGGDRVVMLLDQTMRGRSTGIEVGAGRYAQVATFRAGLMIHWKFYGSQSKALEAAGLSE